jgi:hypothetical protein
MGSPGRNSIGSIVTLTVLLTAITFHPFAQGGGQEKQPTQKPPAGESSKAGYEVLAKGVVAGPMFQTQFKSAPLRLEFRNWIMGRGDTETIPTPTRILMELRQGSITTTINGEKSERRSGDFWMVEKGAALRIQNPGEVGVVRAIYIYENSK